MLNTKLSNVNGKLAALNKREQIEVLRKLWTEKLVTYKGQFHDYEEVKSFLRLNDNLAWGIRCCFKNIGTW